MLHDFDFSNRLLKWVSQVRGSGLGVGAGTPGIGEQSCNFSYKKNKKLDCSNGTGKNVKGNCVQGQEKRRKHIWRYIGERKCVQRS